MIRNRHCCPHAGILAVVLVAFAARGAPPPPIPGEEISEEFLRQLVPEDTVEHHAPPTDTSSKSWLDDAMESWNAPSLAEQIGEDRSFISLGKGAVFVPRFTEAVLEPDVEIVDSSGEVMARGKPGRSFSLLPGPYSVLLGSGSHQQQIVRDVRIEEGKLEVLVPDWAGLSVEVVNEQNLLFAGDYELVRIDEFEPYGRGRGADPDLGEEAATWVLKPGIYKLFSVGESYNTLSNFITVRLLAGRLTPIVLVVDEETLKIQGGGIVQPTIEQRRQKLWSYGLDLGGSVLFSAEIDRLKTDAERASNSSTIALLLNGSIRYNKQPLDWLTSLRFEEGLTITDFDFSRIENSADDVRLRSLFIWRLLSRVGPYARAEVQTSLFPTQERLGDDDDYFVVFDEALTQWRVDSSTSSLESEASFSPFIIESGIGANMDIFSTRVLETKFRVGFGYSFTSVRSRLKSIAEADVPDSLVAPEIDNGRLVQKQGDAATHEAGPEAALSLRLFLGRWAMLHSELRIFAPFAPELRFTRPDLGLESTLSWRLTRAVTLDYELDYTLRQPEEENLQQDNVRHGVHVRYSLRTQ